MSIPLATTTAGLRGAHWKADQLPRETRVLPTALRTSDGASATGFLYQMGQEKTVVCLMHPREMLVTQYLVPEILAGGAAVWVMGSRNPGSDLRLEHEKALLDLAAGQRFLQERGFEHRVLLGTSGGGPLAAFYVQQAELHPSDRLDKSPAGKPTGLREADMPSPEGLILVSSHLGQGPLLLNCIDPAAVDEDDPLETDDSISAFNPHNGFREPPESSRYSSDFIARYREAQLQRVQRIDQRARDLLDRKLQGRQRFRLSGAREDAVLGAYSPIFQVWRTDADPRCYDLSLDASDRAYGSLWGPDPLLSNFGSVAFARVCTPESWLSNWSALSSNATMAKCAPSARIPTLMIQYTGDNSVFPSEADVLFDWLGASDKTRNMVVGNHHGGPVAPGSPNGQPVAGEHIRAWLESRGFTR